MSTWDIRNFTADAGNPFTAYLFFPTNVAPTTVSGLKTGITEYGTKFTEATTAEDARGFFRGYGVEANLT